MQPEKYDVIVVGAGNAALSAAIAAREEGARVLVLEKAPEHLRGGNTYFTGGLFRFPFNGIEDIQKVVPGLSPAEVQSIDVGRYAGDAFYHDLMRVTQGLASPDLARTLVGQALSTMQWLRQNGVRFTLAYGRQAFKVGERYRFWGGLVVEAVGGGKGLSEQLFTVATTKGAEVRYNTGAMRLLQSQGGAVSGVLVKAPGAIEEIRAGAVVLACGGFEADAEMRARYLGPGWELARVRGTRYNTGDGLRMALEAGAQSTGHWSGCHSVQWDLNAPRFGDRRLTDLYQKHSYPFGIMVNVHGQRFVDEGEDFRNYTYVRFGRAVLMQPMRTGFQIFDAKVKGLMRDEYHIPEATMATADTIGDLADRLAIDRKGLVRTTEEFNAAVEPGEYNPAVLDGKHTRGIEPPKSNWALPLDTPPYVGYTVTCGITFTFGGVTINGSTAQVLDAGDDPISGLYAAGELVGGLFYYNYPGGSGLMAGAVFGRVAGAAAARETLGRG